MDYKLTIGILLSTSILAFVFYYYRKANAPRSTAANTNADDGFGSGNHTGCSGLNSSCDSGGDGGGGD